MRTNQTRSQENHVRIVPVAPTRGLIFDRNGVLLADNTPNYQLVITARSGKRHDSPAGRLAGTGRNRRTRTGTVL